MNRWVSVLCFLMAAPPAGLLGQYDPFVSGSNPVADPRVRRANREQAVAMVGPQARDFVETHGDEAVAAIFACTKPVAAKLAEFHASGELGKLPRPRDLLYVIAQPGHGDDVALWAVHHPRELSDKDSFDAYLISPLDYAMGLKHIAAGAAETRARRLSQTATKTRPWLTSLSADEKLAIVGGAGLIVIAGILLWRRRQTSMS